MRASEGATQVPLWCWAVACQYFLNSYAAILAFKVGDVLCLIKQFNEALHLFISMRMFWVLDEDEMLLL